MIESHIVEISPYIFLKYAAQLMGCLDRPEGTTAVKILQHIAKTYPGALYYPFKITSEYLGVQGRALSATLKLLLHNSTLDIFVESLNKLTHPELRYVTNYHYVTNYLLLTVTNHITITITNEFSNYL